MPNEDERLWIRALGHLSDCLSERDLAEQLARDRIGHIDGFPGMRPSIMVLSLRSFRIGDSSLYCDISFT